MQTIIIGNGAAGLSAAKTFRKLGGQGRLILIGKEGPRAYSRVLLPYVLRQKLHYEQIFLPLDHHALAMDLLTDEVIRLDAAENRLHLAKTGTLQYDQLLIASGSRAVSPPIPGLDQPGVFHLWNKNDLAGLLPLFAEKKRLLILGSGFIALQAAWAAVCRRLEVEILELAARIMPRVLDTAGSELLLQALRDYGVRVQTNARTERVHRQPDGSFELEVADQPPRQAELLIVGAGVRGNLDFLAESGLSYDTAIPVDRQMRSNFRNIYAAGDIAAGPSVFGEAHVNYALWPTAVAMGKTAGANLAGQEAAYPGGLNMNVTQMFGLTVASLGDFQASDCDLEYYQEQGGYCKLCYREGALVGACLVGHSETAALLGRLQPLIRRRIHPDCPPQKLDAFLNLRLFGKASAN